ncbi:hypothetical protein BH10BAC3_BH10BAC3_40230 [soil metagenome]
MNTRINRLAGKNFLSVLPCLQEKNLAKAAVSSNDE